MGTVQHIILSHSGSSTVPQLSHVPQARAPYVQELSLHVTEGWEASASETLNSLLLACADIHTLHISSIGG